MSTYTVVPAQEYHLEHLAENMRESDVQELQAARGDESPLDILQESLEASVVAWVALKDDLPVAIWGVAPVTEEIGGAWLLGTPEMYSSKREVMELSYEYVEVMHDHYPILCNYVDARNETSIRWLHELGFHIEQVEAELGVEKRPFFLFWRDNYV